MELFVRLFSTLFKSITLIDIVIIITGIFGYVILITNRMTYTLNVRKHGKKTESGIQIVQNNEISAITLSSLKKRIALFNVLVEILPLLGTLGTVVGLIDVSSNPDHMKTSFLVALTSTFWGIAFAVSLKIVDVHLSHDMKQDVRIGEESNG